jgi:hypothetical protein
LGNGANWIKEGAGSATVEAHQTRFFFQWMALDGVFLFASAPVRGGPAAHLLAGPTYRKQPLIFHQGPKTTQYYVCFVAENITAGVERGRGKTEQNDKKRVDASLLP